MTDPQPPATPDPGKTGQRTLLISVAAVVAILCALGGLEAFNQMSRQSIPAPTTPPVAEIAAKPADPKPTPEPTPVAEPEVPAPVAETPKPAPVAETPKPAPVAEAPTPAPVVEKPVPVMEKPAPAPVAEAAAAKPAATETPAPAAETTIESIIAGPTPAPTPAVEPAPAVAVPAVAEVVTAKLAVTKVKGEPPVVSNGDVTWKAGSYPSLSSQYTGTITFASGGTAAISFVRSFVNTPSLTLDIAAKDGPLQGVAAIAVLRADGKDIAIDIGPEHAVLVDTGAADGSFEALANATELLVAVLFENGETARLTLTKPPKDGLEVVLFPDKK